MTKKQILIGGFLLAAAAGTALYAAWRQRDTVLEGSGTVEARDIRVGSKIGGRIAEVRMREGDFVQPGQVLVTFDDQELKAALEQSRANFQKMTRGYRPEEIAEARAAAEQAKADYEEKKNGYRQEDIDAARAELDRAKADEVRSEADFHRYDSLAKKEMVSRQQRDTAEANWKMAAAQRQSAEKKLAELERGYRPEEIAAAEARYKQTVATYEKLAHGNRREDIEQARAQLDYDEARYREREVLAPSAATVEVLDVRPGDSAQTHRSPRYSNAIRSTCASTSRRQRSAAFVWDKRARCASIPSRKRSLKEWWNRSISRRNSCRATCRRGKSASIRCLG